MNTSIDTTQLIPIIVSIIGCLTGIASLVVVIVNNIFMKGTIRFSVSERRGTYYFSASDTETSGCINLKICAAISIKATNSSAYPTTIDEAYIGNRMVRHMDEFNFEYIELEKENHSVVYRDIEEKAILPLQLEPFQTKYFSFVFPYFESQISEYGTPANVILKIVTPRKTYKLKASVQEYYCLMNDEF